MLHYFSSERISPSSSRPDLAERYAVLDDAGIPRLRRAIVDDIQRLEDQHKHAEACSVERFVRDFGCPVPT